MASGAPLVMGVLNVTPDSFSDGGRFADIEAALAQARALVAAGADWLDVGGESTRPQAQPVTEEVELARVLPVVRALREQLDAPVSIDTRKPGVARAAIAAGASMWNDITALTGAPESLQMAAKIGAPVVLMHMQGEPATMQDAPHYEDALAEVCAWLGARAEAAMAAGVPKEAIWLDPGIGFGKRLEHNLALLARLDRLVALGFPVLLGASRKRTVQYIDPTAVDPMDRLGGSLAIALHGARAGVAMVRVHDVRETVQALKVQAAILAARRLA
ncbi:dihydropteroate synthase [Caulobacter sp. S45]|uniref:dihydropteroate synthase n=1 Tax=Caulobacter sp. S45 TaxID=1641861 RepID=UPI0020C6E199|nr:dihydropteroate synthase [Caulobacter sp. S45]